MLPDKDLVVDADGFDAVIRWLGANGFEPWGPVVRDGAVVPGPVATIRDLPVGWHGEQEPGRYRMRAGGDREVFGWAVGPGSWKTVFLPPRQTVWRATRTDGSVRFATGPEPAGRPVALVGVRPCELAALRVLDAVLLHGAVPDPSYARRRTDAFVMVVECSAPASTCFCASMGTGPASGPGYDVAATELGAAGGDHRFLLRAGTERGADLIGSLSGRPATADDIHDREAALDAASSGQSRRIDADVVAEMLGRGVPGPSWETVAERCLACGNCTLVCPTCFCSDVRDVTDIEGTLARERVWASCFDLEHSFLHGGPVRRSRAARYRQWMSHKLSTWQAQFGTRGCVGCGRCITWCPVGIDLTAEAAAIAVGGEPPGGVGARP